MAEVIPSADGRLDFKQVGVADALRLTGKKTGGAPEDPTSVFCLTKMSHLGTARISTLFQ